jgi:hypothetical protein
MKIAEWIHKHHPEMLIKWEGWESSNGRDLTGSEAMLDWDVTSNCGKSIVNHINVCQTTDTHHQMYRYCTEEIAYG